MTTEVAALGPYFAVTTHQPGQRPSAPWRPMTELVVHPDVLARRIEAVRQILATGTGVASAEIEWRVAASTVHLGLIARLVAPALAFSVLSDRPFDWSLARIFWQPAVGGPYPLSVPGPPLSPTGAERGGESSQLAADFSSWIVGGPIEQLTHATRDAGSISDRVLQGNVASALHSAAELIVAKRKDLGDRVSALVHPLGDEPLLRGSGRVLPSGRFRRHSCCLIYRAVRPIPAGAGRAVCGDCVLAVS